MSDTATTNWTKDDLVRKIAGLLATAESFAEQGNEEAAGAYVQKAHTLQQKYAIDQAMLEAETGKKVDKIVSKKIPMPGKWGKRKVSLAHNIATATSCSGYYTKGYATKLGPMDPETGEFTKKTDWDAPKVYYYVCFGFESDVEHVEFLVNSLATQMDSSLEYARKNKSYWDDGKSFAASFCMGFSDTVGTRLREAARIAKREAEAQRADCRDSSGQIVEGQSVSLVLASKKKQVEDEMRAQVGRLGKGSAATSNSYSGYAAGQSAGRSATIARGSVGGSGSRGSLGR